jgi:glycosyltransferase involved in cell wall biosynthesis
MIATLLRYFPTYSETFVYREIAALRAHGEPVHVLTMRHRRIPALLPQSTLGGSIEELPRFPLYLPILAGALRQARRRPRAALEAVRWGRRHLRLKDCLKALWMADDLVRRGVDLMHVHFAGEGAEVAEIIRRCTGIPYTVTLHARDLFVPRPSVPDLLARACHLVCISEFNRRWLEAHHGPAIAAKASVVRLGVPVDAFPPAAPAPAGAFPLLAVSRLVEKKGMADLIRAVALLRREGRPVMLTIAGDGKLRRPLEALVRELGLEAAVRMPGPLTQAEIEALYQAGVGAFVLPAVVAADGDRDGIPVALMEAMARAVAVVSTPVSGIPELIDPEVCGLLVPPGDPEALAGAIRRLIDDVGLRSRLGTVGKQRVRERFSLDASVRQLRGVLGGIRQKCTSGIGSAVL